MKTCHMDCKYFNYCAKTVVKKNHFPNFLISKTVFVFINVKIRYNFFYRIYSATLKNTPPHPTL